MVKIVDGCKFKKECKADEGITESPFTCCAHCTIQGGCPNEPNQCNEVPDTCCGVIAHEPARIERCIDKECKGYGKPFVDRGYGYPVCPANKPSLSPLPMKPQYEGQYMKEGGNS